MDEQDLFLHNLEELRIKEERDKMEEIIYEKD